MIYFIKKYFKVSFKNLSSCYISICYTFPIHGSHNFCNLWQSDIPQGPSFELLKTSTVYNVANILKVYVLAKLFGEQEKISVEDQQILQAAAILHDVAIKYCKEHYNGDASQNNQKQAVSILVTRFLESANYLPSYVPKIIELVNCYHDYDKPKNKLLQLLMEADLIVNKDTPIPVSLQAPFEQGGVFLCVPAELYAAAGVRRLSFVFA